MKNNDRGLIDWARFVEYEKRRNPATIFLSQLCYPVIRSKGPQRARDVHVYISRLGRTERPGPRLIQ